MYLVIETNTDNGRVREVYTYDTETEAVEGVVDHATDDEYFSEGGVTEKSLREQLAAESAYEDGGVLTTIFYVEGD